MSKRFFFSRHIWQHRVFRRAVCGGAEFITVLLVRVSSSQCCAMCYSLPNSFLLETRFLFSLSLQFK